MIRSIASTIYFFISIVIFATLTGTLGLLPGQKPATWAIRTFGRLVLKVAGIKLEVEGLEHLNPDQPAIYMANHTTILDIAILPAALPVDLRFIYKQSLSYIPIVGWGMLLGGMIPIQRGSMGPAMKSLKSAARRIRKGVHVGIFPEGTRSFDSTLGPLKKGGFLLANLSKADIVPVHVADTRPICHRNMPYTKPGRLKITIFPPIPYSKENKRNREDIMKQVESCLSEKA